jgi:hypothetical protein
MVDFSASDAVLSIGGKFVFLIMLGFLVFFSTDTISINTNSMKQMISNKGLNKDPTGANSTPSSVKNNNN